MARVFVNSQGQASFFNPQTGGFVFVPLVEAKKAESEGLVPESPEDFQKRLTLRKAGESPGAALAAGLARGATLGLSDIVLPRLLPDVNFQALQKANPTASAVGDVAGIVGSALIPGAPVAQLARGARAAGTAATRGLTRATARPAISRVAGSTTRGAIEGAGLGAGQGISQVALTEEKISAKETADKVFENALLGATIGAPLGLVGGLGSEAFRTAKGKLASTRKLTELRAEKRVLQTEVEAEPLFAKSRIDKAGNTLQNRLDDISNQIRIRENELGFLLTAHSVGSKIVGLAASTPLRAAASLINPRILQSAQKFLRPVIVKAKGKLKGVVKENPSLNDAIKRVSKEKPVDTFIDETVDLVTSGNVSQAIRKKAFSTALQASSRLEPTLRFGTDLLKTAALAGSIETLSRDELKDLADDVQSLPDSSFQALAEMARNQNVDETQASNIVSEAMNTLSFLKQESLSVANTDRPTATELAKWRDTLETVNSPESIIEKLSMGRANGVQLRAMEAVHPAVYEALRMIAFRENEIAKATNTRFNREQSRMIEFLLKGEGSSKHAIRYQDNYEQGRQGQIKERNVRIDMANKAASRADQIINRV